MTVKPDHWVHGIGVREPCKVKTWNKGQGTASVVFLDGHELEVKLEQLRPMRIGETVEGQPKARSWRTKLRLVRAGREYLLELERCPDGVWLVWLAGDVWATGQRIRQGLWRVVRENREQQGMTLAKAVTALFYNEVDLGLVKDDAGNS